ncbi:hypothetical protein JoomaDRAFT_3297 [Galbibacter orientalis DSM 19592]|uniref:VWA domain-containing protein n=1 Tax=Galbibacter orientalis DSM 19592 TaxID=926559 RepID=I3C9F0_9FLAO|nr:hypothetical protein [Galbibacter orientalis]EIJ40243.1 hypothetical protein JoomaDRAFT_3297 [Galbibacter orientalis DSM 19592]
MIGVSHVIYIVVAAIISLLITLFMYRKNRGLGRVFIMMALLRFVSIFIALLLLLNLKFSTKEYYTQKPKLFVLTDNSSSIQALGYENIAKDFLGEIINDAELNNKFSVEKYTFNEELSSNDSLSFSGSQTNITNALQAIERINQTSNNAIVMLSDGNQTFGTDYQYASKSLKNSVFPVVLGDSIVFNDLRISQLNVNKYAYFKNKFPVEIFVNYEGASAVNSTLKIYNGNQVLFSEKISLTPENPSKVVNTELLANKIGVQTLKAVIEPLSEEKNKTNNSKLFALEVIDQKNKIAIVTDVLHPDIGALKKAIESNEFRTADILNIEEESKQISEYQLVILYQPNSAFKKIIEEIKTQKHNFWIISGVDTDWNFINSMELGFDRSLGAGEEDVLPAFNENYNTFQTEDIGFNDFPPLLDNLGEVSFLESYQTLLFKKIGNIDTAEPQLVTIENNEQKSAILLGEGIWKWRAASFLKNENTEAFDAYFGKLIQYVSSTKKRDRLTIENESFYYGNESIKITASYFDKNFIFNANASMEVVIKDKNSNTSTTFPMLFKGNTYEVDLSSLKASEYDFTVKVPSEKIAKSGSFTILAFDVEKQFVNPDTERLKILADNTGGSMYFSADFSALKAQLLSDASYQSIQKSKENIVSLIGWKWLLFVLIGTLSIEWFLRKYNGLI